MANGAIIGQNSAYGIQDDVDQILTNTNTIINTTNTTNTNVNTINTRTNTILKNTNSANTNINTLLTNTNTNNVANETGTLSQKLSYLINGIQDLGVVGTYNQVNVVPGNTLVATVVSSTITKPAGDRSFSVGLGNVFLQPGVYKMVASLYAQDDNDNVCIATDNTASPFVIIPPNSVNPINLGSTNVKFLLRKNTSGTTTETINFCVKTPLVMNLYLGNNVTGSSPSCRCSSLSIYK